MLKSTIVQTRYLNRGKLEALLKNEFGNNWSVKVPSEQLIQNQFESLYMASG